MSGGGRWKRGRPPRGEEGGGGGGFARQVKPARSQSSTAWNGITKLSTHLPRLLVSECDCIGAHQVG